MLKYALVGLIAALLVVFACVLAADLWRHRYRLCEEPGSPVLMGIMAPVVMFFATMGISDFVMNTLFFKKCRLVEDRCLPGTLVGAGTLPLGVVAAAYLLSAEVDIRLTAVCMAGQSLGAWLGVGLVAGLDGRRIKKCVAWAMLVSAVFLVLRLAGVGGEGGNLTTLPPAGLALCGVAAFLLGMGNMLGMGAKAPYLSLLLMLGLSPACVLPVVMPSCTVSGVFGGIRYIRRGLYQRKVVLIYSLAGFIGVGAGFLFVMNLPQTILQVVMLGITVYTGISMLREK